MRDDTDLEFFKCELIEWTIFSKASRDIRINIATSELFECFYRGRTTMEINLVFQKHKLKYVILGVIFTILSRNMILLFRNI